MENQVREKYRKITNLLIEKNLYITTMESCTGGLIASLITDTEGSSGIIKGAFVTYSNEAKIMQGVPKDIIDKNGVYSEATAIAMANAARSSYHADIAIGVTGTSGNIDPDNADSIPGQVYFAIATNISTKSWHIQVDPQNSRYIFKMAVASRIADELLKIIC